MFIALSNCNRLGAGQMFLQFKRRQVMSVLNKRRVLSAVAFFLIVGTSVVIWGVPRFIHRSTSIKGQVTSFLLDDRGSVNGLLLSTGDQLHFSPETGALVGSQLKVGDEVTATGHAGTLTNYGREIHAEQLSFNGQTITEIHSGPKPRPGDDGPKGLGRGPRIEQPIVDSNRVEPQNTSTPNSSESTGNQNPQPEVAPTPEVVKLSGTVKTHLVNGHGDVDGVILNTGEQIRVSPKVGELIVAAEQAGTNLLNVEGTAVRNDKGVVIRPKYISIGSQTINLGQ
jgi:hypothetical protein